MSRNRGFTDADMAEVSDNPEWTDAELASAKPFADVFPDLAESLKNGIEVVRVRAGDRLSVALSGDMAAYYGSFGKDAEGRLDADLRKLAGLADKAS